MGDERNETLDEILGQLEDELRHVKSARGQVEEMVAVSEKLRRLVLSSNELVEESGTQMRETVTALSEASERLSERSEAIERVTSDGIEAVRKQATDAQTALEQSIESIVSKVSTDMADVAERSVSTLNDGIAKSTNDISTAAEALNKAIEDNDEARDLLLKAHDDGMETISLQSAETRELLGDAREVLASISEMVETLREFDVKGLAEEIRELKVTEDKNATALQERLKIVSIMIGVCIAIGIMLLLKLFML